jgi:hypothetical protein
MLTSSVLGRSQLVAVLALGSACLGPPPPLVDASTGEGTDDPTTPTTSATTSPSSTGIATNTTASTTETESSASTTAPTSTGSTSAAESSSSSGSSDIVFFDDFERPDSLSLGNGWVEKSIDAWQLLDGRVQNESNEPGFSNAFIYQPDVDVFEVEASVEFRHADVSMNDYPQVHGRLDPMATLPAGMVRSYGVFVDVLESNLEVIRSDPRGGGPMLAEQGFASPITDGTLYRVTIRITGTDEVLIEGMLERFEGDRWIDHATIAALDDSPDRIVDATAVGTSGNLNIAYVSYDNFLVRDLAQPGG